MEYLKKDAGQVLCLVSRAELAAVDLASAQLVVIPLDLALHPRDFGKLPTHVPLLVLSENPEDTLPSLGPTRLLDFLRVPVSISHLNAKITFLQKVYRLGAEGEMAAANVKRQLDVMSGRDLLTGLYNRESLTRDLPQLLQAAREKEEELTLLILNIDYFNKINKTSGRRFGDRILNEIAARITEVIQKHGSGSCYRFSGEDFVICLPEADLNQAENVAARLHKVCTEKPFAKETKATSLTVSLGIASLKEHQPGDHDEFISMVEAALYLAKAEGRNRILTFSPIPLDYAAKGPQSLSSLRETLHRILEKTRNSTISSLRLLARNVAGPDHRGHIDTVSSYIKLLGAQLGLKENHIETFQNATTLYNSIRFFLHSDLLCKQAALTFDERRLLNDLPHKLSGLTEIFDYFAKERKILIHHNERFDGSGGPQGLRGEEIPIGARIFHIVDALAAMNSERPFRKKMSGEAIVAELSSQAGKHFDPVLLLPLLNAIEQHHLLEVSSESLNKARAAIQLVIIKDKS